MSWNRPQGASLNPPPVCFNCEQPGHYVVDCPRPSRLNAGAFPGPPQQQQSQGYYQPSQYGQQASMQAPMQASMCPTYQQASQSQYHSAQPTAQSYQQPYSPPTPAPYITPQHTGNYPQQHSFHNPPQPYGQFPSQVSQQPYQNPSYPQSSPGYGQPQHPPSYSQPINPSNYAPPSHNQYQQPQSQHYSAPQQTSFTPGYAQIPAFNAPQPLQAWQSGTPAQMSPPQSFPYRQFQTSLLNNQLPVEANNFTQTSTKQHHQKQRKQSLKQYEKNSKKHRNSRKAITNSGFASHPSESFAVDVPRDINMTSESIEGRSRSQSLANASQSTQQGEGFGSQFPITSLSAEMTTEEDEEFRYMSEQVFCEPQDTRPALRLANSLSTNPNDDPVIQEDEDSQSSVSRFATEYNKKEFVLSVKDSHRWSNLQHDPVFKEFTKKHDSIPLHEAAEWWARKEGVYVPQSVIDRPRKRSRSAETAVYESETEASETSTLQHKLKKKSKKSRFNDVVGGLGKDELQRSPSTPAIRERTPCVQIASDDSWGPEPGELGTPSSPPDSTLALLATLGRDDLQHTSVYTHPESYITSIPQSTSSLHITPNALAVTQRGSNVSQTSQNHMNSATSGQHQPPIEPSPVIDTSHLHAMHNQSQPPILNNNACHYQAQQRYGQQPHNSHNYGYPNGAPQLNNPNNAQFDAAGSKNSNNRRYNNHAQLRHDNVSNTQYIYQGDHRPADHMSQGNTGHLYQHSLLPQTISGQQNQPNSSATHQYIHCNFDQRPGSHLHSRPSPNFGNGAPPPPPPPPSHNVHNNRGMSSGDGSGPLRQDSGYASERGSWGIDSAPQSASTAQPSPLSIDTSQRPGTASSDDELSPTSKAVLGLGEDEESLGKWDPRKPEGSRYRRPKRPPPVVDEAYGRRW